MFFCSKKRTQRPLRGLPMAGKKGKNASRSVSRVLSGPKGPGRSFLWDMSCNMPHATNPNDGAGEPPKPEGFCRSYSVLLPVGFTVPPLLPAERCALTAPFHPYLQPVPWCPMVRNPEGGLFSVALSLRSPSPVVNRHRSSRGARTFLHHAQNAQQRPSDRLARAPCVGGRRRSRALWWKSALGRNG